MALMRNILALLPLLQCILAQGGNPATYYNVFPDQFAGVASNYGGPAVGGCGYGNLDNTARYPRRSALAFDPNSPAIARYKSLGCGSCWKVTNPDNQYKAFIAMVTDTCPGCNVQRKTAFAVDVDFRTWSQAATAGNVGTYNAILEQVNCQPPNNLKVVITDFRGQWGWIRLYPFEAAGIGVVHRVQVSCPNMRNQVGAGVVELQNTWGAVWEALDATGKFPNYQPNTECAFLLTSAAGQTVYCYSKNLDKMIGSGGTIDCDGNFDGSYSASGTGADWRFGRKLLSEGNSSRESAPVRSARKFLATVDSTTGVASLEQALE